ncbi:MAG: NTP transferase domain-containing protein [Myxococcota bacterium]
MSSQASLIAPRIAGLVLAAGRSARMGAQQSKLVMSVQGKPLVAWPVEAMSGAGIERPFVVTGFEAASVEAALAGQTCTFLHHASWAEGMGASLAFGAQQVIAAEASAPARFDALLLCLGDLPGLRAPLLEELLEAAGPAPLRDRIIIPTYEGRPGHPVLFGRRFWPRLVALSGDAGAKAVIAAEPEAVTRIPVENEAILADIDTAEDLARWEAAQE